MYKNPLYVKLFISQSDNPILKYNLISNDFEKDLKCLAVIIYLIYAFLECSIQNYHDAPLCEYNVCLYKKCVDLILYQK